MKTGVNALLLSLIRINRIGEDKNIESRRVLKSISVAESRRRRGEHKFC